MTFDSREQPIAGSVVFRTTFIRPPDDDGDDEDHFHIGIFSTYEKAARTVDALKRQPGFRDNPDGFEIAEAVIDRVGWTEGFIRV